MCRRRYVLLWLILRNWNLHLTSIVQVPTRHGIVGGTGEFFQNCFLLFVPEHIKKIAYSASFGKSKLDTWEKGGNL